MPDGGGSSGGAVVQSTSPWAATLAGQIGSQAADQASYLAQQGTQNAINSLNNQYRAAANGLRPYTQTGVQALDQLNQYLGLNPYNPGETPVKPTLQSTIDQLGLGNKDVINWINANKSISSGAGAANTAGMTTGAGAQTAPIQNWGQQMTDPITGEVFSIGAIKGQTAESIRNAGGIAQQYGAADVLKSSFGSQLSQDVLQSIADPTYKQNLQAYNDSLPDYNNAKSLYDQYTAQGPMTQDQITNNITNQPGYQAELGQGAKLIQSAAVGKGASGGMLKELMSFGQNTLSKYYQNTLSNLSTMAQSGQSAATTGAQLSANQGNNIANLYSSLSQNQANAKLAGANSLSNALINANQNFNVVGGSSGGGGMGGIGEALGGIASLGGMATKGTLAGSLGFSSKLLKDKVSTPSTEEILSAVRQLDLDKWKYKGIDQEHIGPYAEQFKELLNTGDGKTINMIDAVGALLGAVKELDKKISHIQEKI